MVDKIWYEWQLRFPRQSYLPVSGGPFGQNLTDPMDSTSSSPLGARPVDVVDSQALNIEYDRLFPGTPPPQSTTRDRELIVGATEISAQISTAGEEDKYYFEMAEAKSVTIETSGNSDTTLTLFGPDNSTNQIAFDDDGGDRFNSQINQLLPAGRYSVSVRLYDPSATGSYQLAVRSISTSGGNSPPQIPVNGAALDAEIVNAAEIDLFHFVIQNQGTYTIKTTGSTDTYMNLFGPDSQTQAIAENDDSGLNRNSQLRLQLSAGEYFVRIRHYDPAGTGAYKISVAS
jgi:tyrosinase